MSIAARNAILADGAALTLPRSYMLVSIPSDNYDFRITFAGQNVKIKWGDGSSGTYSSSPATHSFAAGDYDIEIGDTCTRFECPESYGRTAITEVGFGQNVTYIDDGGYQNATSLVKIACAPSVSDAVNRAFKGCSALDWICDFPVLNLHPIRFDFLPFLNRQFSHIGYFSSQQAPGPFATPVMWGAKVDYMDLLPALTSITQGVGNFSRNNYYFRRIYFPLVEIIENDSFYGYPNLYGVYCPKCSAINACLTRSSSRMNNNPLGVTHIRLGHLSASYTPGFTNRGLCWGGSENYLGVFMVDMTRAELSTWLSTFAVPNFISQSAFTQKAICTDDPEWSTWDAWFAGGMELADVPTFPLNR